MGLLKERNFRLTSFGNLIVKHDPFFEIKGSLEYVHYLAAGNYKNLIWFEVFNTLLASGQLLDYSEWLKYFRKTLAKEYSKNSLQRHLPMEVRFIIEAYIENGLKQLELISKNSKGKLIKRRYLNLHFAPLNPQYVVIFY